MANWRPACVAAASTASTADAARAFFEAAFAPVRGHRSRQARWPAHRLLRAAAAGRAPARRPHRYPLYRRPPDLVSVDLGQFDPELRGPPGRRPRRPGQARALCRPRGDRRRRSGRPRPRAALGRRPGAAVLSARSRARVRSSCPMASIVRVGYADQNGRPYRAIGKDLIEMGAIPREQVSMQAIRDWLEAHPGQAPAMMAKQPSYVFFREMPELADRAGAGRRPGRAADARAGRWPSTASSCRWARRSGSIPRHPIPDGDRPLRRLVVAQDTGGAIQGPVRGDVFWGAGPAGRAHGRAHEEPRPPVHPAAARPDADELSRRCRSCLWRPALCVLPAPSLTVPGAFLHAPHRSRHHGPGRAHPGRAGPRPDARRPGRGRSSMAPRSTRATSRRPTQALPEQYRQMPLERSTTRCSTG